MIAVRSRSVLPRPRLSGGLARRAAPAAAVTGAGLLLFGCYLRQSRTVSVGSDGASQALQAWDMLHGNPLLHGWWVTDVSFYTTELPQYALIEFARGLSADVIHVAGAMTYTLLVLAAAFLARGRATGRAGLARALLAGGVMLAPSLGPGTQTLVLSPDHTGTGVPVLLVLLLIDRAPGRWYVPPLVWVALALTALADAITIFVAVIPLALVCASRLGRDLLPRRRMPGTPGGAGVAGGAASPRRRWYEGALLAAAVLAVPAEVAAARLIGALGGWQVNGLSTALAGAGRLAGNARLTGEGLLELFGADVFGAAAADSPRAVTFAVIHLAGVALAVTGVIAAARSLRRRSARADRADRAGQTDRADLVVPVLLVAIVIDVGAYLFGVQAVNILSAREIAPVLPFAAVLAGRSLGDWLTGDLPASDPLPGDSPFSASLPIVSGRRAALGPGFARYSLARYSLCVVLAVYVAMLGYAAARPPAAPQYAALAGWLRAHHLADGLSGYHQANIVTLESGGAVTLRTVVPNSRGYLTGYTWNASTTWFNPAERTATYLVLTAPGVAGSAGGSGFTAAEAVRTFGRPARVMRYQGYLILIWHRGENLLARLRKP